MEIPWTPILFLANLLGILFIAWLMASRNSDLKSLKEATLKEVDIKLDTFSKRVDTGLEKIEFKLNSFILEKSFNDYKEAHGREHVIINDFMVRHRDWKHETEPKLRGFEMHIDDFKGHFMEFKEDLKAIKEKLYERQ